MGINNIKPVNNAVLSLVNFNILCIPCKSPNSILILDIMSLLGHHQLKGQLLNSENITMLRNATTKKGMHIYGVNFSTEVNIFTAGLREVGDGKACFTTKDILNEIPWIHHIL